MFVGLVDGDGYIEIGPPKQYNKSGESQTTIRAVWLLDYIREIQLFLQL